MSLINVTSIQILDNPTKFTNPFRFEISFECISPLKQDLEWKVIYVGAADSEEYDQVLDSVLLGPINVGLNKFEFQSDPPDPAKIPAKDLLGVTVVIVNCCYRDREFFRVGYYVNNEVNNGEGGEQPEMPPVNPKIEDIERNILNKPVVTLFPICWDDEESKDDPFQNPPPPSPQNPDQNAHQNANQNAHVTTDNGEEENLSEMEDEDNMDDEENSLDSFIVYEDEDNMQ